MPTFSKNTRRSASSVGLVSNITYPAPDGATLDSNSDGSDLRHIAGIYRGENIINPIGGGSTIVSAASFGFEFNLYPVSNSTKTFPTSFGLTQDLKTLSNLTKTSPITLSTDLNSQLSNNLTKVVSSQFDTSLSSQFVAAVGKTANIQFSNDLNIQLKSNSTKTILAGISTDLSSSFNNSLTKTTSTRFDLNLSSNFAGITTTVLTAPQISFSLEQGLLAYPALTSLLNAPKIFLSVDNNVQLSYTLGKTTTAQLSTDLYSQLTPNLTKTSLINLELEQNSQINFALTKTLTGLSLGTELSSNFSLARIKSGSVVFAANFDSQFSPNLTKTTSLSLDLTQGVFIGGTAKTTVINVSFGTELCSQFKAVAPSILDSNPSTFNFIMYICKEVDYSMYITKEKDFNTILKGR